MPDTNTQTQTTEVNTGEALAGFASLGLDPGAGIDSPQSQDSSGASASSPDQSTNGAAAGEGAGAPEALSQDSPIQQNSGAPRAGVRDPQGSAAPAGAPAGSRNQLLAGISDLNMVEALRYCSNQSFNALYPVIKSMQDNQLIPQADVEKLVEARIEEYKTQNPQQDIAQARYLDHEEGYMLTPEYRESAQAVENLAGEGEFWQTQLTNIKQQKPFYTLRRDEKGNYSQAGPFDPKDPTAEAFILGRISSGAALLQNAKARLAEFPTKHKAAHEGAIKTFKDIDTRLFGNVKSPEFAKLTGEVLKQFPVNSRTRPEVQLLARALSAAEMLQQAVQKLSSKQSTNSSFRANMTQSPPSPSKVQTGGAVNGGDAGMRAKLDTLNSFVR